MTSKYCLPIQYDSSQHEMITKIRQSFNLISRIITAQYRILPERCYTTCSRASQNSKIMSSNEALRSLYPICEPYDTGRLQVDDIHTVYYEQCGKPDGNPVVFMLVNHCSLVMVKL